VVSPLAPDKLGELALERERLAAEIAHKPEDRLAQIDAELERRNEEAARQRAEREARIETLLAVYEPARDRADNLTAWRRGLFCALGRGDVDLAGFCRAVEGLGYDGWVVVEQDRVLAQADGFAAAAAEQSRNREWLREHAGW